MNPHKVDENTKKGSVGEDKGEDFMGGNEGSIWRGDMCERERSESEGRRGKKKMTRNK